VARWSLPEGMGFLSQQVCVYYTLGGLFLRRKRCRLSTRMRISHPSRCGIYFYYVCSAKWYECGRITV